MIGKNVVVTMLMGQDFRSSKRGWCMGREGLVMDKREDEDGETYYSVYFATNDTETNDTLHDFFGGFLDYADVTFGWFTGDEIELA